MFRRFLRTSTSSTADTNNNTVRSSLASEVEASSSACVSLSPIRSSIQSALSSSSYVSTKKGHHERLKDVVANAAKVEELKNFDDCIEAADALASTATTATGRVDPSTGLVDCTVLVSSDGELLIIPQLQIGSEQQEQKQYEEKKTTQADPGQYERLKKSTERNKQNNLQAAGEDTNPKDAKSFWQIHANELGEEYKSAVFLGNDIYPNGDKMLNGFSAKGWSMAAASLALKQSSDAMKGLADCVEALVLTKKTVAVQQNQIVDQLRSIIVDTSGMVDSRIASYQKYVQKAFPDEKRLEVLPTRVGPLLFPGGTVPAALVALENYYSNVAESDSGLWRSLSQQNGALTRLRSACEEMEERVQNRQIAIQEMTRRAKAMEDYLVCCKKEAKEKWDLVHAAELKVTQLVEEKAIERNRRREKQRLEQITQDASQGESGATSSEIWDLVSSVTAEIDEGSFAPMDVPQIPIQRSLSTNSSEKDNEKSNAEGDDTVASTSDALALQLELEEARYELEERCGLPDLRRAALSVEEAVENIANSLLSVLSNLDTTSRSARLAAETSLISSSNAQATCLRSIIETERASLEERLKQLEDLERVAEQIDVRADMNNYIAMDKKQPGGESFLGDDDDGGVAIALAVLNEYTDGEMRGDILSRAGGDNNGKANDSDDSSVTPEYLEESVEKFFQKNPLLNAPNNDKTKKAKEDFRTIVSRLCEVGKDKSSKARTRRSTICYTINAKRTSYSKLPSKTQFDGLCQVFYAILSGCGTDDRGVSNAKLLMSLSQLFYFRDRTKDGTRKDIFIKSHIINHPMWEKDEFWDQALNQAVGESLTHSGVMANFERSSDKIVTTTTKKRSEWTQTHKTRWHDLTEEERYEAASQIHAVVFTQVGSMSHSMREFGCSVERTSAFIRRMCIRNQLPMSQRTTLLQHLIGPDDDVSD